MSPHKLHTANEEFAKNRQLYYFDSEGDIVPQQSDRGVSGHVQGLHTMTGLCPPLQAQEDMTGHIHM